MLGRFWKRARLNIRGKLILSISVPLLATYLGLLVWDYYRKNPVRYSYYRYGCGRDQRLKELWGQAPGHRE